MLENIINALLGTKLSREDADLLHRFIETRVSKPTPPSAETFDLIKRYSRTAADMGGSFAAMVDKVEAAAELERPDLASWAAVERPAERADLDALAASTKADYRRLADAVLGLARRVSKLEGKR